MGAEAYERKEVEAWAAYPEDIEDKSCRIAVHLASGFREVERTVQFVRSLRAEG